MTEQNFPLIEIGIPQDVLNLGVHILVCRDGLRFRASELGAAYLSWIFGLGLGLGGIRLLIEYIRCVKECTGKDIPPVVAISEIAQRRMYGDVSRFLDWLQWILRGLNDR